MAELSEACPNQHDVHLKKQGNTLVMGVGITIDVWYSPWLCIFFGNICHHYAR
jgi:hypothetical protein